jgi:hypothetical protein
LGSRWRWRGFNWVRNVGLAVAAGNGERSWRVTDLSLLVVLSVVFLAFGLVDATSSDLSPLEHFPLVLLSTSSIEGFVGAVFIGLFLSALMRRIHR